ncbi:hypothetical protein TWF696_001482 [Orbilia brochopaga]|uniref:Uncharacterized protein n=1 Tax=Orbilia brochopaga TaxID=3140254 RepID=A0AAV9U9K1_9PEZI
MAGPLLNRRLIPWALLLVPAVFCEHRGYFTLRILPVPQEESPFSGSPMDRYIITAPTEALQPIIIRQQPAISPCPSKPDAIYDPSSIWLADWRLSTYAWIDAGSRATASTKFFSTAQRLMDAVTTPLLRSLHWRTRTLTWAYLSQDQDTPLYGRIGSMIVPDTLRSTLNPGEYDPDVMIVTVDGVGLAESVRLMNDPAEPKEGSPSLQPNLTPPADGGWVVGTIDGTASGRRPYFAACKTAEGEEWHLFRNPEDTSESLDATFNTLYPACFGVYIQLEPVSDNEICFRWDLSNERNEQSLQNLAAQRLFTVYHNSISSDYPQIITDEIDELIRPPGQTPSSATTQQQALQRTFDDNVLLQPGRGISQLESIISTIDAVPESANSFGEGFSPANRINTPAFGSTDNSGSGSRNDAGGSGSPANRRQSSNVDSPGLSQPDEIILLPGTRLRLQQRIKLPRLDAQEGSDGSPNSRGNPRKVMLNPQFERQDTAGLPDINGGTQRPGGTQFKPRPKLTVDTAFKTPPTRPPQPKLRGPGLRIGSIPTVPSTTNNARQKLPTGYQPLQNSNNPMGGLRPQLPTRQSVGPGQKAGFTSNPGSSTIFNPNQAGGLRRPPTRQSSGPGQRAVPKYNPGGPTTSSPTSPNQAGGLRRPITRQSSGPGQKNGFNSNAGSPTISPTTPLSQKSGPNSGNGNSPKYTSPRASANLTPSNSNAFGIRKGTTSSFRPNKPSGYLPIEAIGTRPGQANTITNTNPNSRVGTGIRAPNPSRVTSPNSSAFLTKDGTRKNGIPPKFNSHRELLNYAREKQGVGRLPELEVKGIKTMKSTTTKLGQRAGGQGQRKGYPEIKVTTATAITKPANK